MWLRPNEAHSRKFGTSEEQRAAVPSHLAACGPSRIPSTSRSQPRVRKEQPRIPPRQRGFLWPSSDLPHLFTSAAVTLSEKRGREFITPQASRQSRSPASLSSSCKPPASQRAPDWRRQARKRKRNSTAESEWGGGWGRGLPLVGCYGRSKARADWRSANSQQIRRAVAGGLGVLGEASAGKAEGGGARCQPRWRSSSGEVAKGPSWVPPRAGAELRVAVTADCPLGTMEF